MAAKPSEKKPEVTDEAGGEAGEAAPAKSKKKLLLIAVPVVLLAIGAGGWFSGAIPKLLGKKPVAGEMAAGGGPEVPDFVDIPEILTNLNVASKRPSYVKLHAKLEIAGKADEVLVQQSMPRILDMFQTYLRDLRPEELKGSIGSYRLREELVNRASIAAAPARINDVLFVEMVVE